jgi:hypothetical protein
MTGERSRIPIPAVTETSRGEADMFVLPPLPSASEREERLSEECVTLKAMSSLN